MAGKSFKLTYFNFRGMGESIRYIFSAAGVKFEDNRVDDESWPALKPTTPFGQLPNLEVDGKVICQSKAIGRFLAGEFGLVADNAWDNARIDMVVDNVEEMRIPLVKILFPPDEDAKKKNIAAYQDALPTHLANLQKIICDNNNGDGFFVGEKMTWADINFAGVFLLIESVSKLVGFEFPLANYPKLKALREKVEADPGIAAYIANRPASDL